MYSQIRLEAKVPKYRKIRIFRRKNYENARAFHLPRQVSCTINRTLVNRGKVGHNIPQTRMNTTVSTTKAHGQNQDKGKCFGRNP